MCQVSPVQSLPVGSEKQSWIFFKSAVREVQVVPSHLAAHTITDKGENVTDLFYLPGGREGLKILRMFLQYKGQMVGQDRAYFLPVQAAAVGSVIQAARVESCQGKLGELPYTSRYQSQSQSGPPAGQHLTCAGGG